MPNKPSQKVTFNKENIMIKDDVLDINLKLYIFLKHLNNSNKLTENQVGNLLLKLHTHHDLISEEGDKINRLKDIILDYINTVKQKSRENFIEFILNNILNKNDFILLQFALELTLIKPFIIKQINFRHFAMLFDQSKNKLPPIYTEFNFEQMSLKDEQTVLISYLFFEQMKINDFIILSQNIYDFINSMKEKNKYLKTLGLNPSNQFRQILNGYSI